MRQSDLLLIQEAEVSPGFRAVVEHGGFSWLLSSAFEYQGAEYGVLTATRVAAGTACTLRAYEPLILIPKAALITHYRLAGRAETLAVANLHAINFALGTDAFRHIHHQADHLPLAADFHGTTLNLDVDLGAILT